MASGKAGLLYLLCLSRAALRELYEHHLQDQLGSELSATYKLFGAEPYSFADERHYAEPAALREFGALSVTQKKRKKIYDMLPSGYQEIINKHHIAGTPFGPYVDGKGRYYKFENLATLTVLKPKGRGDFIEFPEPGETLILNHVDDSRRRRVLVVNMIGMQRGNTCLLECINES